MHRGAPLRQPLRGDRTGQPAIGHNRSERLMQKTAVPQPLDVVRSSLWMEEALDEDTDASPALHGRSRADICIVGGGYTGLWTALAIKDRDPSVDVALVEASICGAGASGA